MQTVYIGLGSNLKERLAFLNRAVEELDKLQNTEVTSLSSVYETDPVGGPLQGRYLNAVCAVDTSLAPAALLEVTKKNRICPRTQTKRSLGGSLYRY